MSQMTTIILTFLFAGAPGIAMDDAVECKAIKERIRHIQSRMRSGYTRAQGERMEAQLRKLRKQRKAKC